LEQRLNRLEAAPGIRGSSAPVLSLPPSGKAADLSLLQSQMLQAQKDIVEVQAQVSQKHVNIGNIDFKSKEGTISWVLINQCGGHVDWCVDPVSLLEYAYTADGSADSQLLRESSSKKVGYLSPDDALVATSLSLSLLTTLGKPGPGVNLLVLPALKTFEHWDKRTASDGHRTMLTAALYSSAAACEESISASLYPETVKRLGSVLVQKSLNFCLRLFEYMTFSFENAQSGHGASKEEAWQLFCSTVQALFRGMHARLNPSKSLARHKDAVSRTGTVLWSTLQAHGFADDLMKNGFAGHPIILPVINNHILLTRLTKETFEKTMAGIETKLKNVIEENKRLNSRLAGIDKKKPP
jgi:hypothetical protein